MEHAVEGTGDFVADGPQRPDDVGESGELEGGGAVQVLI
jgi:hypothetical protein